MIPFLSAALPQPSPQSSVRNYEFHKPLNQEKVKVGLDFDLHKSEPDKTIFINLSKAKV